MIMLDEDDKEIRADHAVGAVLRHIFLSIDLFSLIQLDQ